MLQEPAPESPPAELLDAIEDAEFQCESKELLVWVWSGVFLLYSMLAKALLGVVSTDTLLDKSAMFGLILMMAAMDLVNVHARLAVLKDECDM